MNLHIPMWLIAFTAGCIFTFCLLMALSAAARRRTRNGPK